MIPLHCETIFHYSNDRQRENTDVFQRSAMITKQMNTGNKRIKYFLRQNYQDISASNQFNQYGCGSISNDM